MRGKYVRTGIPKLYTCNLPDKCERPVVSYRGRSSTTLASSPYDTIPRSLL